MATTAHDDSRTRTGRVIGPEQLLAYTVGRGRSGRRDQARLFSIARGSAYECQAILDILEDLRRNREKLVAARQLLTRCVALLTGPGAAKRVTPGRGAARRAVPRSTSGAPSPRRGLRAHRNTSTTQT
ncbi:MAG: four helix bundle protein [Vicinamibacteria bacterium]|jgi:hypothetical protein|nr:four helix bundle protein [Vicinamibacteria bacterium]